MMGSLLAAVEECDNPLATDCSGENKIYLMQPLDDETHEIAVTGEPLAIFFDYFNMAWPWLLGVASGMAVLQAVVGGIQIMMSGGDTGDGKTRITAALYGMVIIALVGFILRFLNAIFYV